jgi:hypothetical protein
MDEDENPYGSGGDGAQKIFVAVEDEYLCEDCLPDELRAHLGDDDVSVWEEGSAGWTGPVSCRACGRAIPVVVEPGEEEIAFERE